MKYSLCIINQNGRVIDSMQFKNKKSAEKWIAQNILRISLEGKSVNLYNDA